MVYFLLVSDCIHKNMSFVWNKCYFMVFVRILVHPVKNQLLVASGIHANK